MGRVNGAVNQTYRPNLLLLLAFVQKWASPKGRMKGSSTRVNDLWPVVVRASQLRTASSWQWWWQWVKGSSTRVNDLWLVVVRASPGQLFHGNDGDNGWKAALPESMTCDWLLLELANSGQRLHSNDGYNGFAFCIQVKQHVLPVSGIIMCMCPANERWRYIVMPIGLAHTCTQNDPCVSKQPPDDDMGGLEHSCLCGIGEKKQQGKSEGFESCDRPIVRKRPIWVKIGYVLSRVTLKFDGWPWKTIGHLFFAVSSFVQHFIAIGEFKLELQSGNAHFESN